MLLAVLFPGIAAGRLLRTYPRPLRAAEGLAAVAIYLLLFLAGVLVGSGGWLAPLFTRHLGRRAPIAAGGATAMDTTLPVISRYAVRDVAAIAVFSGVVLTVLVPLLITLLLT